MPAEGDGPAGRPGARGGRPTFRGRTGGHCERNGCARTRPVHVGFVRYFRSLPSAYFFRLGVADTAMV